MLHGAGDPKMSSGFAPTMSRSHVLAILHGQVHDGTPREASEDLVPSSMLNRSQPISTDLNRS